MTGTLLPAILVAAGLLGIGLLLRMSVAWLRWLYLPASVVAGVAGFLLLQILAHSHRAALSDFAAAVSAQWMTWPSTLIAIVFAALLLENPQASRAGPAMRRGLQSAVLAWIIILGQIVIGLIVYRVAVYPSHPEVPATFGQLLEVSWAGGPGSAAAMGTIYARQGFAAGRDLAFFLSTIGLIYGVVSGLIYVNIAVRRGWTARPASPPAVADDGRLTIASPKVAGVIEPLAAQIVILAAAYAAGLAMQQVFLLAAHAIFSGDSVASSQAFGASGNVPLFLFTLLGGWCVRRTMQSLRIGHWIDRGGLQQLTGIAMEFLIVAGIATIRLDTFGQFLPPITLLLFGAAIWSAFCLLVLSRPLLPRSHWFELGLLNYGFSTANTPQGLMLLRIIDPTLQSGAAEDYALAAPFSAPFVGGGIITFVVLPVALQQCGVIAVTSVLLVSIGLLLVSGRLLARKSV